MTRRWSTTLPLQAFEAVPAPLFLVGPLIAAVGCKKSQPTVSTSAAMIYIASRQRQHVLREGFNKLSIGMSEAAR